MYNPCKRTPEIVLSGVAALNEAFLYASLYVTALCLPDLSQNTREQFRED